MWIIPKILHTSLFVPDMEALTSDSQELFQQCAQSLLVKSKPMHVRTWLRKWNQDSWIQRLYGRILKPSHGQVFLEKWISSLEDSLANHLALQENVQPTKTQDISSHIFFEDSENWGYHQLFFSKMSKELLPQSLSAPNGPILQEHLFCSMCLENWNAWVTAQRQEYSARLKLAPRTNANECLYLVYAMTSMPRSTLLFQNYLQVQNMQNWPIPTTQETPHPQATLTQTGRRVSSSGTTSHSLNLCDAALLMHGHADEEQHNTLGSPQESQNETTHVETQASSTVEQLNPRWVETLMGLPVGWTMASCATPWIIEAMNCGSSATESSPQLQSEPLEFCGKTWPTPTQRDYKGRQSQGYKERGYYDTLPDAVHSNILLHCNLTRTNDD